MFLTNISIKRPVFAIVVIIAMIAVGIVSFMGLPINNYPNTDVPVVLINVTEPGASPDSIETNITKKVEEAVGQVANVKHITSNISEGNTQIMLEFTYGSNSSEAAQNVKDKMNSILATLPADINDPIIQKLDMSAQAIVSFVVTGSSYSNRELSDIVDNKITKRLNTIKGIGSITTYGGEESEVQVKLDKEKLSPYGITASDVTNNLMNDNVDLTGGKVSNGDIQLSLRSDSKITKVEDFLNVLIAKRNEREIRLGDVAEVERVVKEKSSLSYYKGKESIGVDIVKQPGENTTEVADNIKKELSSIQSSLPSGIKIDIVTDNSISIRDSVTDVEKTMVEGCLLAVVIVFLFLRNWGSTAISAISLPTSIVTTFAVIKVMGFSLNMMSLMGLSLAVGLLVDDAIVVIENIVRHLHMGKSPIQAAKDGTTEIGLAVTATTLTVVAVFLPIAMINGMIGEFFKQFGVTVAASVLVSLFVSFTLVPLMSSRYLAKTEKKKVGPLGKFLLWFNHLFDKLAGIYIKLLGLALRHRIITIVVAFAMFFGSLTLIPKLGMSFMDSSDDGKITVSAGLDGGATLDSASKTAKQMESIMNKYKQVQYLYTTVTDSKVSTVVKLVDKSQRKETVSEIGDQMRKDLVSIPGINLSISSGSGFSSGKAVQINLKGNDFDPLYNYALQAEKIMKETPGAVDVAMDYKTGTPETKLEIDRDKCSDLGISPAAVGNTISTLFNGSVVTHFQEADNRYDVRVLLKGEQRKDIDSLDGIYVAGSNRNMIPLSQVTKKVFSTSSTSISRYDKARSIKISANVVGITANALNMNINNKLKTDTKIPNGVSIGQGSDQERLSESITSLATALFMGILFIFLVLAAQFESFIDPLSILFSLPFAIIGAILALFIGHKNLSMMAAIGVIMLMGLVTKNAILLIDFAKQKRADGVERGEALKAAAGIRLRPIIMTTLAMIFGMLPAAIATGSSSENRVPMAYTIIGGLITSTFLTLVVVPVIYTLLDDFKGLFRRKKAQAVSREAV